MFGDVISSVSPEIKTLSSNNEDLTKLILPRYKSVFQGDIDKPIESHKVHIVLKPDVIPKFRKAYEVDFHLRKPVKKKIVKLQSQGVLVPINYSEWATPLVVVRKN